MSSDAQAQAYTSSPSTLVDPFTHYEGRRTLGLRHDARLFSNSEGQTFKRCRRKWYLAWYLGLRFKRERPTGPRAVGDRVHRALALWYVADPAGRIDPRQALEQLIESDRQQIVEAWKGDEGLPGTLLAMKKDDDLERAMLEGYVQWLEETGADSGLVVLESESYQDTEIPLLAGRGGVPVYIIAKLDARVRRISDSVLLFIDHKTVGGFAQKTLTLSMDEQMLWYDIIERLNGVPLGERTDGALFNMLRRVKRTASAKPPFYQRLEVRHNRFEIESFYERLWGLIQEVLRAERRLDAGESHRVVTYPTPTPDCSWDCDFFLLCPRLDDGSRTRDMIDRHYVRGDPLSYYARDIIDKKEVS
jgi:hypothetical protein